MMSKHLGLLSPSLTSHSPNTETLWGQSTLGHDATQCLHFMWNSQWPQYVVKVSDLLLQLPTTWQLEWWEQSNPFSTCFVWWHIAGIEPELNECTSLNCWIHRYHRGYQWKFGNFVLKKTCRKIVCYVPPFNKFMHENQASFDLNCLASVSLTVLQEGTLRVGLHPQERMLWMRSTHNFSKCWMHVLVGKEFGVNLTII